MSTLEILPGRTYSVASTEELAAHFAEVNQKFEHLIKEAYSGVKPIRFASSTIQLPGAGAYKLASRQGPQQGFVWMVMRLSSQDTAQSASRFIARVHDIADLALMPAANIFDVSQVDDVIHAISGGGGAASAITFSKGQFVLQAGEFPAVFGWTTAATQVAFNGDAIEVPAEMVGKLLM